MGHYNQDSETIRNVHAQGKNLVKLSQVKCQIPDCALIIPPTWKKLGGAYCFRVVRLCVIPFFTLFDACHISWTVHAKVLKFHTWIIAELSGILLTTNLLVHDQWLLSDYWAGPIDFPFSWSSKPTELTVQSKQVIYKASTGTESTSCTAFDLWTDCGSITNKTPQLCPFLELCMPLRNLISKIPWKLFELGARNLVSW